jgi:hypothetical protein
MYRLSAPSLECQLRTFAATALLSCVTVAPVFAQAAIQESGYFAQFYPNLDVLNGGAPTPAARLGLDPAAMQLAGAFAGLSAQSAKALIVMSDPYYNGIVEKLVALAHQ